jgi:hypothetical protein
MQLVVNHLTRMEEGFICVAGMEIPTHRHIRPVLAEARLTSSLLACHGGVFELGAVIDLGQTAYVGQAPEVEDHQFVPNLAKKVSVCSPGQFWSEVQNIAMSRLVDIFGLDLKARGYRSCGVDLGKGKASLGCLIPASPITLSSVTGGGRSPRVLADISDGQFRLELSVTDIRLFQADHLTPKQSKIAWLEPLLVDPAKVVVSVGLTRPFAKKPSDPKVHWLQINNIHLAQDPLWA